MAGAESQLSLSRASRGGQRQQAANRSYPGAQERGTIGTDSVTDEVRVPFPAEPSATSKLAYTIAEVAELLGLCRATIYKLIGEGQLRTIYLSERTPRVLHEDVVAFLQRKRDEAVERSEFIRSRLGTRF